MKIFGVNISRAKTAAPLQGRITRGQEFGFGWFGTKLSPQQVRSLLAGMRAGDLVSGYELFAEMQDTWHTLAKNLQQLRAAVASVHYRVAPDAEEGSHPTDAAKERAEFCQRALTGFNPDPASDENGFEDFIYDLTDALLLGVSVQEILYAKLGGEILPRATVWMHPNQYGFGADGRLGLAADAGRSTIYAARSASITPFPDDRFILATYKTQTGSRAMNGLLRPLAWWWCAVQYGRDWVLRNAELFGQPIRDIEYDPNIKPEDLAKLETMAADMGSSAWITRPTGTKLTLVEAQKTGDASPQSELLDRADTACDLMILWQTLTSATGPTGGGSLALGQVHEGVLDARKQHVANWAANVICYQLFPALLRLNYGDDDDCPAAVADHTKPETLQGKADRLKIVKEILPLPKTWAYDQLGVPEPQAGEDVLEVTAPPPPFGGRPGVPVVPPVAARRAAAPRSDAQLVATAVAADLAPFAAKYAPLLARLETALAMTDAAQAAEIDHLRPELEAMLADTATVKKVFGSDSSARVLAQLMTREFFNGLADAARPTQETP